MTSFRKNPLIFLACALFAVAGPGVAQNALTYQTSPEVRQQLEQLRTTDKDEVQRRWGDLASLADKAWIHKRTSDNYGMDMKWLVPGAAMHIAFAWCNRPSNCKMEWTVQYNAEKKQLDFYSATNELVKTGTVQPDGSVDTAATGLLGSSEKWKYDAAANTLNLEGGFFSTYVYAEVSRQQLLETVTSLKDGQTLAGNGKSAETPAAAVTSKPNDSKPIAVAKASAQEEAVAKVQRDVPQAWGKITCSEAGYGGRPASRCATGISSEKDANGGSIATLLVSAWVNPEINSRAGIYVVDKPRYGANKLPADPIVLKVDGRVVRQFKAEEFIDYSGSPDAVYFNGDLPFDETLIQELASGSELTIEFTGADNRIKSVRFPVAAASRSILSQLPAHTRTTYRAYYNNGKAKPVARRDSKPSPTTRNADAWGVLGEAADRSPAWISKLGKGLQYLLELKWVEPGKAMHMHFVQCDLVRCDEQNWTIRVNPNAIVYDKPVTALVFYNEANKPVIHTQGSDKDGNTYAHDFDPVLYLDMKRSLGMSSLPYLWKKASNPCCIVFNSKDFSPASPQQVQQLFADREEEKRRRVAQAEADERARQSRAAQAQADRYPPQRADRGPQVYGRGAPEPQRSFAQTFADTFQQEMRNKQAQDNRQQAFLNNLGNQMREIDRQRESRQERERERLRETERSYTPSTSPQLSRDNVPSRGTPATPYASARSAEPQRRVAEPERQLQPSIQQPVRQAAAPTTSSNTSAADYWAARRAGIDHPDNRNSDATKQGAASLGRAGAWCIKAKGGKFMCTGPFQKLWAPEATLELALSRVGCAGGSGYSPSELKGEYFDCGRDLKPSEQKMPTYDPFANYNK
ncbi:hypothetical protein EDC30_11153 [Paucimonas lemoignei]|uniref:Uncharacterized protein n=2 Tax=Paucimonas lemoignei TaxID=29443 RepID=A0A4V2UIB0_PAULE|nr:hypothetical protein EDC30_11153 [Paucimonas lemoignei]